MRLANATFKRFFKADREICTEWWNLSTQNLNREMSSTCFEMLLKVAYICNNLIKLCNNKYCWVLFPGWTWDQRRSLFVIAVRFSLEWCVPYRKADSHRFGDDSIAKVSRTDASSPTRPEMVKHRKVNPFMWISMSHDPRPNQPSQQQKNN